MNTVTYGTASASFLATRCLKELALANTNQFSKQSKITLDDFYVDDLLTGTDSVSELITIKNNVTTILNSAGFAFRKFRSNDSYILSDTVNSSS